MIFRLLIFGLFGLLFAIPTHAAESYDNCNNYIDSLPATISTQGTWCLRSNLSTNIDTGSAITVAANNVTIDCNDFKIGGLAAGPNTQAAGIFAANRSNVVVRNCSVRGFATGIQTFGTGGYHVIENNILDNSTAAGIRVAGDGSIVRGNRVSDSGGSTVNDAYGIRTQGTVNILDNWVNTVFGTSGSNGNAYGIYTDDDISGSVVGNSVSGLAPDGTGNAYGIYNNNSGQLMLRDNNISHGIAEKAGDVGIRCTNIDALARDSIVNGFLPGGMVISGCTTYATASN